MKTLQVTRKSNRQAFTLIEMIGVLAVIAILAAVLIPKVFSAINNARVNNAAMSVQTVKTASRGPLFQIRWNPGERYREQTTP